MRPEPAFSVPTDLLPKEVSRGGAEEAARRALPHGPKDQTKI